MSLATASTSSSETAVPGARATGTSRTRISCLRIHALNTSSFCAALACTRETCVGSCMKAGSRFTSSNAAAISAWLSLRTASRSSSLLPSKDAWIDEWICSIRSPNLAIRTTASTSGSTCAFTIRMGSTHATRKSSIATRPPQSVLRSLILASTTLTALSTPAASATAVFATNFVSSVCKNEVDVNSASL
ncbi:unannotated protein [freshwater metagenome]|uniref:Unannotated protein n=1 Tax=freshwater metagenome TaxID=449393 RepID=A0A6J7SG40_9ZZZZ